MCGATPWSMRNRAPRSRSVRRRSRESRPRSIYTCLLLLRSLRCSRNRSSHEKPSNGQRRRMFHCRATTETSGSLKPPATAIIGCWDELTAAPLAKRSLFPSWPSQLAVRRSRSSFMMAGAGNMCLLPLISRVARSHRGMVPPAQSSISPAEDGYFHLSLSLVPTADTEIHFTMAFLNANNAIVYPGREGKAVLLRKIDIDGLLSSASVSEVLAEPLIAREVKQWATAENVALQSTDGAIRVTETRGYGYHRLLGRIDGGCAGQGRHLVRFWPSQLAVGGSRSSFMMRGPRNT